MLLQYIYLSLALFLAMVKAQTPDFVILAGTNIHSNTEPTDTQWISIKALTNIGPEDNITLFLGDSINNFMPLVVPVNDTILEGDTKYYTSDVTAFQTLFTGLNYDLSTTTIFNALDSDEGGVPPFIVLAHCTDPSNIFACMQIEDIDTDKLNISVSPLSSETEYYTRVDETQYSTLGTYDVVWTAASLSSGESSASTSPSPSPACATDMDGDGTPDCSDDDIDGDGVLNDSDGCPLDVTKTVPGDCGCGVPDEDADSDGIPDCVNLWAEAATLFGDTNLHYYSQAADLQWFSIKNTGSSQAPASELQVIFDGGNFTTVQSIFINVEIGAGATVYYASDAAGFESAFAPLAAAGTFAPIDPSDQVQGLVLVLALPSGMTVNEILDFGALSQAVGNITSPTKYYERLDFGGPTHLGSPASYWQVSDSASPAPASCVSGVWDTQGGIDDKGLVPFAPRLVTGGATPSTLGFDGNGPVLQLRVRVSDWFDQTDAVSLSSSSFVCGAQGADYAPGTSPVTDTSESDACPYTVYEASFPYGGQADACAFDLEEDPVSETITLSGYVAVNAVHEQDWLGQTFSRSFSLPLGFYVVLDSSFDIGSTTAVVTNTNQCYDDVTDCSGFECVPNSDGANLCDCTAGYASAGQSGLSNAQADTIRSVCENKDDLRGLSSNGLGGIHCENDAWEPVCVVPTDSVSISITNQSSTITVDSSNQFFEAPYWDDCDPPNGDQSQLDASDLDFASSVTKNIARTGGLAPDAFNNDLDAYTDGALASYTLRADSPGEATTTYTVTYSMQDLNGNPQPEACQIVIDVTDAAPPVCTVPNVTEPFRGIQTAALSTLRLEARLDTALSADRDVPEFQALEANIKTNVLAQAESQRDFSQDYVAVLSDLYDQTCLNPQVPLDAQHLAACQSMTVSDAQGTGLVDQVIDLLDNAAGGDLLTPVNLTTFETRLRAADEADGPFDCELDLHDTGTAELGGGDDVVPCMHEGIYAVTFAVRDDAGLSSTCASQTPLQVFSAPLHQSLCEPSGSAYTKWVNPTLLASFGGGYPDSLPTRTHLAFDSWHYRQQIQLAPDSHRTPSLSGNDIESGDFFQAAAFGVAYKNSETDNTQVTFTDFNVSTWQDEILTSYQAGVTLSHPQFSAPVVSPQDFVRLYIVHAYIAPGGYPLVCSVEFEPQDWQPPAVTCPTDTAVFPVDADISSEPARHLLTLPEVQTMYTLTDAAKTTLAWESNADRLEISLDMPDTDFCAFVYSLTLPYAAGDLDRFQGRASGTRRRRARRLLSSFSGLESSELFLEAEPLAQVQRRSMLEYVNASCGDNPFLAFKSIYGSIPQFNVTEFELQTRTSTDLQATLVQDAHYWNDTAFHRGSLQFGLEVDAYVDNQLVEVQDATTNGGYYAEYETPQAQSETCGPGDINIIDITPPVLTSACDAYTGILNHTMTQTERCSEIGFAQDLQNHLVMSTLLQDNAQLQSQDGYYEYVHFSASYLQSPELVYSNTCYERGTGYVVNYTAFDSSGNQAQEACSKTFNVWDLDAPEVVCNGLLDSSAGAQKYVVMDPSKSYSVQTVTFTVIEGQSQPSDWTWLVSNNIQHTSSVDCSQLQLGEPVCQNTSSPSEYECTFHLNFTDPEEVYACEFDFVETEQADHIFQDYSPCILQRTLIDTQSPVLNCPANLDVPYTTLNAYQLSEYLYAELLPDDATSGSVTYSDNWAIDAGSLAAAATADLLLTLGWVLDDGATDFTWRLGPDASQRSTGGSVGQGILEVTLSISDVSTLISDSSFGYFADHTVSCDITITPVPTCGDGYMDLSNGWNMVGGADECEIGGHPEAAGCIANPAAGAQNCICDRSGGMVPDPQGGCFVNCTSTQSCAVLAVDTTGTDTLPEPQGSCSLNVLSVVGPESLRVDPLYTDCTPGDPPPSNPQNTWGPRCFDFYTAEGGAGSPHHPYGNQGGDYYTWADDANAFMSMDSSDLDAFLLDPDLDLAFEWYYAGSENDYANDTSASIQAQVCGCTFSTDVFVQAFVMLDDGSMVSTEEACDSVGLPGLEGTYDDATACWTFPLCRTGPVVIGEPKVVAGNLLDCLDETDIYTDNSVLASNTVVVDLNILDRVNPLPGLTLDTSHVSFMSNSFVVNHSLTTDLTQAEFYVRQVQKGEKVTVTVAASDELNQTDSCSFDVFVADVTPPTIDCSTFEIAPAGNVIGLSCDNAAGVCTIQNSQQHFSFTVTQKAGRTEETLLQDAPCGFPSYALGASTSSAFSAQSHALDASQGSCDHGGPGNTTVQVGGTLVPGTIEFDFYLTDMSGNNASSCSRTYTVIDAQQPTLTCPHDSILTAKVQRYDNGTDSFTGDLTINFTKFDWQGFTAAEGGQPGGQTLTDTETFNFTGATRLGGGTDDGTGFTVYSRTITRSDFYGNPASCIVFFKFEDQDAPVLTCHDEIENPLDQDSPKLWYSSDPQAPPLLALDLDRDSSPFYSVTDNTDSLAELSIVYSLSWGTGSNNAYLETVSAGDESTYESFILGGNVFALLDSVAGDLGAFTSTWQDTASVDITVTDVQGNTETCSFDITFADTRVPDLLCPVDITSTSDPAAALYLSRWEGGEAVQSDPFFNQYFTYTGTHASPSNEITLLDPATYCLPTGFAGDTPPEAAWCPSYMDVYGGWFLGGNPTVVSPLVLQIAFNNTLTYVADDSKSNTATLTCTDIAVLDDLVPIILHCNDDSGEFPQSNSFPEFHSLDWISDPASPENSVWNWADSSLDRLYSITSSIQKPEFTDNTEAPLISINEVLFSNTFFTGTNNFGSYADVDGEVSITDSFPNTDTCTISASIIDNVPPVVRSCSLNNRQLFLSNCTSDEDGTTYDPVRSCYYNLTYEVAEDMALSSLCSVFERDSGTNCAGTEVATDRYGPGAWPVTEVGAALVPPYLEVQGGLDSVSMARDQTITDWQGINEPDEFCDSADVIITDDVAPVIIGLGQTCFSDPTGITAPGTIRLLQTETETVIPESLAPAPRAVDADIYDFHVNVTITNLTSSFVLPESYSLQYDGFIPDPYDGEGFVDGYVTEAVSLPVGVYQFEYLFRDSHSQTSVCYAKVEVLPAFEALASETQTSLFLIQEAFAGGGGGSGIDSTAMELSLQYVYATSYPFVSDNSSALITATSPPSNIDYDPLSNLPEGDLYCAPGRAEAGPEVSSHTEAEGFCFRTYEITGDFTNCSAVDQTISITHPVLCSPTAGKTYHYDSTGSSPFDYTLSNECLDDQEDQNIEVDMYSQSFCQTQIGSVALDGVLAVGDNTWMSARLDATTEGTDHDDYYDLSGASLEPFAGDFVVQGSAPEETIELCLVFLVETDAGVSPGSVQFASVDVDEVHVSWSNESGVDPADVTLTSTDWTEHSTSQADPNERTNMIGICFQQPRPAELAVNGTNSEDLLTLTVSGSVVYNVPDPSGRRRRRRRQASASFPLKHLFDQMRASGRLRQKHVRVLAQESGGETYTQESMPVSVSVVDSIQVVRRDPTLEGEDEGAGDGQGGKEDGFSVLDTLLHDPLVSVGIGVAVLLALACCLKFRAEVYGLGVSVLNKIREERAGDTGGQEVIQLAPLPGEDGAGQQLGF